MSRAKKSEQPDPQRDFSPRLGFEGNHTRYREILATMERARDIDGIRGLFRRLSGLLDQMELCIRSQVEEPDSNGESGAGSAPNPAPARGRHG